MTRKLSHPFIAVAMLLLVVVLSAADDYLGDDYDFAGDYDFAAEDMLPLRIPLDRSWDVQWNPPGHPILSVSQLRLPIGEVGAEYSMFPEEDWPRTTRTGYYIHLHNDHGSGG